MEHILDQTEAGNQVRRTQISASCRLHSFILLSSQLRCVIEPKDLRVFYNLLEETGIGKDCFIDRV